MSKTALDLSFEGQPVRTFTIDDTLLFAAVDVCAILGLGNTTQALTRLDDDETTLIPNEGRDINVVTEGGLYSLILGSRKAEAKDFKRWVTQVVLPTIRRTGTYTVPATTPTGKAVTVGLPMRQLPEPVTGRPYQPAAHWEAVAAACRDNRGMWLPITIEGFTADTYRGAVGPIRRGALASFRRGAWDASFRDGVLYVRYLPSGDELLRSATASAVEAVQP